MPATQVPPQVVGLAAGQPQAVPAQTPPLGHVTHRPPQLVFPLGQTHVVPAQTPPTGHAAHVPPHALVPAGQHVLVVGLHALEQH